MRGVIGVVAVLVFTACAPPMRTGATMSGPELLPSVQATPAGDGVRFVFQITNTSADAVDLVFTSGQSFDFVVRTAAGADVWRWSADRSFIQVVREETLGMGETLTFEAGWPSAGAAPGEYIVEATLTASGRDVRQSTTFRIP